MARATRDAKLESRTSRARLEPDKYHWRGISKGLALGYRRGTRGASWTVRQLVGDRYETSVLGHADDTRDANGEDVLDYFQAQDLARKKADERATRGNTAPYTVADAARDYLEWFEAHRKSLSETKRVLTTHVLPKLGDRLVSDLTAKDIRAWHHGIARQKPRLRTRQGAPQRLREESDPRARKATANRVLTVLKAALNHAFREGEVPSDLAWRKVKPFPKVNTARVRFLSEAECRRLVNACPKDFRRMVQAALYTGCRYSELTRLLVGDYHADSGTVHVREAKGGRPRHVPLTDDGKKFFARETAGRKRGEIMFIREDGEPWATSHQVRPILESSKRAKIDPPATFHALRHTVGSALAMKGVPLQVIAAFLGHADTRITERHYAHLMPSYVADTIRANLPDMGGHESDNVERIA